MRGSIRCALGAALLAVLAVPVVAGATDLTDGATADVVTPVEVAPTSPPSTAAPVVDVIEDATPPAEEPVTGEPAAAPVTPEPGAVLAQQDCDPNYFGGCVPPGATCSDMAGIPFLSIGADPYGLDGDGDGTPCESDEGTPVTPETTVPPTTAPPTTAPPTTAPPTTAPPTTTASPTTTTPSATSTTLAGDSAGACHPSYAGACLPVGVADVDCTQVTAVDIRVVGPDVYRLDGDSDGVACESDGVQVAPVAQVRAATITRTSTASLASTGSSAGIGVTGAVLLLIGLALTGGGMLATTVGPWRTRGGYTVVRYDRYGRERRDRVVNDRV